MYTYTCQTAGLRCDGCGGLIPVGTSFAVISTPSKPYKNTCNDCAGAKLEERYAWADSPDEETLRITESRERTSNRKAKESRAREKIREKLARDLTERRERANIHRP